MCCVRVHMSFHLRAYVRGFFFFFTFRGTLGPAFLQQECLLEVFAADSCFIRARMLQRAKVLRGDGERHGFAPKLWMLWELNDRKRFE